MPRIRCHYLDCVFLDEGYCTSSSIELDPDAGCLTYSQASKLLDDEDWGDEEFDDEWEDLGFEEDEDDDFWLDEDDDDF